MSSVDVCLRGYLDSIYLGTPSATTREVVKQLRGMLGVQPAGMDGRSRCLDKVIDLGLACAWRDYYREERRTAVALLRTMTIRKSEAGESVEFMLQTKLPLPDVDSAPTLGEATILQLQRASAYVRRMQRSLGEQARRIEELTKQLAEAAMLTGKPDLTLGEAEAEHLINWRHIHAA